MRLYVIGDVHGHLDQLKAAHDLIRRDGGKDAVIAHVGDLIDRGPDSRGVVDYLIAGLDAGRPWVVTKGNHDRMLPRFLQDPAWIDPNLAKRLNWTQHPAMGAAATLQSYGVDPYMPDDRVHTALLRAVPDAHRRFLDGLPLWFLHPLALVVHAGIRPGTDLQDQIEDDLVWIRAPFLDCDLDHGPLVVHGHTAIEYPVHYGNRVNIDGGAAYGRPLRTLVLEGKTVHLLSDQGRVPLLPRPLPGA